MPTEPSDAEAQFAALAELAEMFTALVQAIHCGDPARFTAARIVEVAARCVPASKAAELMVLEHGRPRTVAAAGSLAEDVAHARLHTGEGPSLDVLDANDLVTTGDLTADERWPEFARQVTRTSRVRSVASYRLYLGPDHKAALTFYSDWPYAFDNADIATGAIFAAYCSLALFTDVLADTPSLKRAAEVHREIGVAAGILLTAGEERPATAYRALHDAGKRLAGTLDERDEPYSASD